MAGPHPTRRRRPRARGGRGPSREAGPRRRGARGPRPLAPRPRRPGGAAQRRRQALRTGRTRPPEEHAASALRAEIDAALATFGVDRLLFGGDWPVSLAHASYGATVGTVRDALAELSADEQDAVLRRTASRVYGLDDVVTRANAATSSRRR
nr:amidohydrolase family protein [Frondihabitans sucicola]